MIFICCSVSVTVGFCLVPVQLSVYFSASHHQCFCGTADEFAGAVSSDECGTGHEFLCTGDSAAACGGDDALSLIHISEPTRLGMISYAVFCLKKKN